MTRKKAAQGRHPKEEADGRAPKYVVTENVTQLFGEPRRVPGEREPITDKNVGASRSGPNISEEEHEVILHQEHPIVEKEAVRWSGPARHRDGDRPGDCPRRCPQYRSTPTSTEAEPGADPTAEPAALQGEPAR